MAVSIGDLLREDQRRRENSPHWISAEVLFDQAAVAPPVAPARACDDCGADLGPIKRPGRASGRCMPCARKRVAEIRAAETRAQTVNPGRFGQTRRTGG